ncbi:MAG: hypothetical protein HY785_05350 [Oscillatoriophycideae cyanobacterium NC_groundwater_1537_Pr4_S-0.65um_50_18]|jgi:hypothetical protein|nr:hypothetical protein [Oscillatoriophycideae cyanobacterium NC_groundwater_1537_Pr4_S-0.65um_50_18]
MRYNHLLLCACMGAVASIAQPAIGLSTLNTTPTTIATSLDLDGEGSATTHIVKVSDITFSTDNSTGLTLTLTSDSLSKVDGADIDFQVTTVGNDAIAPSSAAFTVASGDSYTYVTETSGTESRDVYLRYTPKALQDPGHYSASIQASVVDN